MDYREYYKKVSQLSSELMDGGGIGTSKKEDKGFLKRPMPEKTEEENPYEIVAKYMAFFRKDAISALEEVGVNADFIKGNMAKRIKEGDNG